MVAVGEDHGLRPDGFDLPNSPVAVAAADLRGRSIVQRTSAGTRGVVAARSADRLWCASLVCASATAAAVNASGLGAPAYVITGRFDDAADARGHDDLVTAQLIERGRLGLDLDAEATARSVMTSDEARRTLTLGTGHVHPDDIAFAARVDAFDFAMEVHRINRHLVLRTTQRRR
jgi:2-phosphosulfolactate phosphatase